MSAAALATADDLAARIGALSTDQAARAPALLIDASALIRAYCGSQTFSLVEDDLVNLRTAGGRIRLPQRPVVAVTSVAYTDGTALPALSWSWDGLDLITIDPCQPWPVGVVPPGYSQEVLQVIYSHGYPPREIPDGLVAVACKMVGRVLTSPSKTDGLASETIGQYSYQAGGGSGGVGVWLSASDKEALIPWAPRSGTIRLRSW